MTAPAHSHPTWQRLDRFVVDDGSASLSFVDRLARENGWSLEFARRALAEYRRFLFLGQVAGHPVTPSDEVDQVWHLHLLYTRSYWDELCGSVLGRPFHHGPTRGGGAEQTRYLGAYEATLEAYRRWFGEPPPLDLWPPPRVRFDHPEAFRRVDTSRHWMVRRPEVRSAGTVAAVAALPLVLAGCTLALSDGSAALLFVLAVGVIAVLAARSMASGADAGEREDRSRRKDRGGGCGAGGCGGDAGDSGGDSGGGDGGCSGCGGCGGCGG